MMLILFFPIFAGILLCLPLPKEIAIAILYAGYAVSVGTIARYSWLVASREEALRDWKDAVLRSCPPHQAAIIKHFAEEDQDNG